MLKRMLRKNTPSQDGMNAIHFDFFLFKEKVLEEKRDDDHRIRKLLKAYDRVFNMDIWGLRWLLHRLRLYYYRSDRHSAHFHCPKQISYRKSHAFSDGDLDAADFEIIIQLFLETARMQRYAPF